MIVNDARWKTRYFGFVPTRATYIERRTHQWWGAWPMDLRRLLHLVPRGVEFSIVGDARRLVGRRALCGQKLIALAGEFVRFEEAEPHRQCSRCVRRVGERLKIRL